MNKIALQKILKLRESTSSYAEYLSAIRKNKSAFLRSPSHVIQSEDGHATVTGENNQSMQLTTCRQWLKTIKREIQQAAKFYIADIIDGNSQPDGAGLSVKEFEKLLPDIVVHLPYQSTFVQMESDDLGVLNVLLMTMDRYRLMCNEHHEILNATKDSEELSRTGESNMYDGLFPVGRSAKSRPDDRAWEGGGAKNVEIRTDDNMTIQKSDEEQIVAIGFNYDKATKLIWSDLTVYCMTFLEDGSYVFWVPKQPMYDNLNLDGNAEGSYTDRSLNAWVSCLSAAVMNLCTRLQFPQITDTTHIKGVKPSVQPINMGSAKYGDLLNSPTWEHKILKINMFKGISTANGNGTGGSPKAFHSVRKHLRRLPTGKITFVKAHWRGSKSIGIVSKDYEIVANKRGEI